MRLFLDINVIVDVLAEREPWVEDSAVVLSLLDTSDTDGFVAAHSITTLFYLSSKHLGRERATSVLLDLLEYLTVIELDQELLLRALSLGWEDVEDAVQGLSAQRARADYLVTRNTPDFDSIPVPAVTPSELVAILDSEQA